MTAFGKLIVPVLAGAALSVAAVGCAPDRHSAIPADAQQVAMGDKMVMYQAPHDGTIYVYNMGDGNLLYSGPIRKGQTVSADQSDNHLTLDGQMLSDRPIQSGDIKLYFKRGDQPDLQSKTRVERSTETTVRHNGDNAPTD